MARIRCSKCREYSDDTKLHNGKCPNCQNMIKPPQTPAASTRSFGSFNQNRTSSLEDLLNDGSRAAKKLFPAESASKVEYLCPLHGPDKLCPQCIGKIINVDKILSA